MAPKSKGMSCATCNKNIEGREFLKCTICQMQNYPICENLTIGVFNLLTYERKFTWKCKKCKSNTPKTDKKTLNTTKTTRTVENKPQAKPALQKSKIKPSTTAEQEPNTPVKNLQPNSASKNCHDENLENITHRKRVAVNISTRNSFSSLEGDSDCENNVNCEKSRLLTSTLHTDDSHVLTEPEMSENTSLSPDKLSKSF